LKGFAELELYYKRNLCVVMASFSVSVYVKEFPKDNYNKNVILTSLPHYRLKFVVHANYI